MKKYKVAFLISHPIQYFSPLFKEMASQKEIELKVYYCSDESVRGMKDKGFGIDLKWDIPLLEGYEYKFLKNYSPKPSIFNGFFGLMNFSIIDELRKGKYDVLIVHGWNYLTNIIGIIVAKLFGIKIFIRGDNPLNQEIKKSKYKIFIKKIILKNFLFKIIDAFLYVGEENKNFYKFYGVPENKLFFTPYAVDNEKFIKGYENFIKEKDKIKRENGISKDKSVILFCGKLIEKKRPMDLLFAYEKINLKNKALVYVGDGILRRKIENYVKEKGIKDVYLLGFKNQSELPKYYAIADIFVLPSSIGETWGLVVNEAMCFNLPIIVSDMVGCAKDLVKHGENGFIYPVGDIEKLKEYMEKLLKEKDLREKMGRNSLKIVSKYTYKKDVEGILEAIEFYKSKN
jgi:glycosyltransferase involved in cell wall biosynthesis